MSKKGLSQKEIEALLKNNNTSSQSKVMNKNLKYDYVKYKDIELVPCLNCKSQNVYKKSIVHPGTGIIFRCKDCRYEYTINYDSKIEMNQDDYWYFKYLNDPNLEIKITKKEIEDFVGINLEENEWNILLVNQNICDVCDNRSVLVELKYDEKDELHYLLKHCKICGYDIKYVLDNLL